MEEKLYNEFYAFLKVLEDCQTMRRHYLDARNKLSTILVTLYSVIIGLAKSVGVNIQIVGGILVVLSIYGVCSSVSYTSSYNHYWRRSHVIRRYIDNKYLSGDLSYLYKEAISFESPYKYERHTVKRLPYFLNQHILGITLHVLVMLFGILVIICPTLIFD